MTYIKREVIEEQTLDLLESTGTLRVPVPVDLVAHRHGLTLVESELGEGVSGVLVVEAKSGTIGYNAEHPVVRQRFSIAHELGHYVLHRGLEDARSLFIDTTKYVAVFLRNEASASGEKAQEIQANMFAAALLMPERLLRAEIQSSEYDLLDEEQLCNGLADKFQVSVQAMSIRLGTLGILEQ